MSSTYTYNDYLRDFLKDASCILAYDTAADYLELWSGSMNPLRRFMSASLRTSKERRNI